MHRIFASLVTYNNDRKLVESAVNSFFGSSMPATLFIIDNSPEPIFSYLSSDPRIQYLHNPANPGFGASHNIAIEKSIRENAKYHLVLNPDVYFEPVALERIFAFMEANSEVGHLMPKVLYPDGSLQHLCKRNPTFFDLFIRGFIPRSLHSLFGNRMRTYDFQDHDHNQVLYDVPYLSGCFMFLRVSVLREVGSFDDRIFMYLEDADLTRRMLRHSRTIYFPEAVIYHHFARFTHKKFKFKWVTVQSAFTYFSKWGWWAHLI
jgi:GT2 family glycosyltransferase